uniref:sensor domain-containing protein n=1 Tax=Stappia sp. TaxID=1870903 RepID=UPI003BAC4930
MNKHSERFWQDIGLSTDDTVLIAALECLPHPAWIFDRDGRYVAQSRIDRDTHGDLAGKLPTEAQVGPENGRRWLSFHRRVIDGEHFHHMREMMTPRGLIHSETAVSPLMKDGKIIGGIGVSVDQTKRVEAENAQRKAQDRLLGFLRISSDWAWETDDQHRFTLVFGNKERLGIDFDAWIGHTRWELVGVDPEADPLWRSYLRLVQAREPLEDFVYRTMGCDGQEFAVEVNAVPLYDADGRFLGYRGVSRNVTERERLHQMLRRSDVVIRATGNVILLTDADGLIEWANPAFSQVTGYSLEEAIGQSPCDLLLCEDTSPETVDKVHAAIAAGRDIRSQILYRTKSGERHWFDMHLRALRDEAGNITGHISHQSVITDLVTAEQRLRATVDSVAAGILRFDASGAVVECNPEACRLLSMDETDILRATVSAPTWSMVDRNGSPHAWERTPAARVLAHGDPIRDEIIGVRLPGDGIRWLRVNANRITTGTHTAPDVIMSFIDITGDEVQKHELDTARRLLHDVIEAIPDAIAAFDGDERLILCNEAYREMYPLTADAIRIGASFPELLDRGLAAGQFADAGTTPEQQANWRSARLSAFRGNTTSPSLQQLSDGRWLQIRERKSDSGVSVGVRSDITALKNAEIAIRRMAETDSLTGLSDRSVMMREIAETLHADRDQTGQALYVMLDLDHFKSINDSLGHDGGDQLLCVIANRLRRAIRKSDIAARLGGDEFALLLAPRTDTPDPEAVIARLHKALTARVSIAGRSFRPGVSMGVTRLPTDGPAPRDLIKNADIALYRTKERGRNGWTFFEPGLRERFERRRSLADRLRRALSNRQMELHFAPQMALRSGQVIGFEAWPVLRHDTMELDQDALTAAAEEAGLGLRLAESTLEQACAALAMSRAAGRDTGIVAVNLTREPLREPGFAETVRATLARHDIPPASLAFEIGETALSDSDPEPELETMARLNALGVRLVLDEFGRSSAALTHLRRVPELSRIKLHHAFTASLLEGARDRRADASADTAIARAVIELAHGLGIEISADGIDSNEAAATLAALGCDIVQGAAAGPTRRSPDLRA